MQDQTRNYEKIRHYGFVGGDVSKGTCDFKIVNFTGTDLEDNFQLDDNASGHRKLFELLTTFKKRHGLSRLIVGLESTGGYENNWYNGLLRQSKALGLEVYRINPKLIYHAGKTEGRRSTSDAVSAAVIAGFLRKNYGTGAVSPERIKGDERFANMRTLHKYIQQLLRQQTRTKNRLEKLLYQFLPELLALKPEKYSNWFLELLMKYPSKEHILAAGLKGLTTINYLTETKAVQLLEALKRSVGGSWDLCVELSIREQAGDIANYGKKIKRLKARLVELASTLLEKEIDLLCSIRGIAEDTAVGILLEVEDVSRFGKASSVAAFFGINPTVKQSGDSTFYVGMSKAGSPSARAIFYMAAENVMMQNDYFRSIYHKHRARGKKHRQAIGAIMSKLARVIYGMLKTGTKFNAGTDILNQSKKPKTVETNCSTTSKTSRRYQDTQHSAPVSNRQRKKRKQENQPQVE